jgi:SAM-dependent methyltransferase
MTSTLYPKIVSYEDSVAAEQKIYENNVAIHDLPPIFHYWSNQHLLPKLQSFGFSSLDELFLTNLEKICQATPAPKRFVSLGAGNCDLEIAIAKTLKTKGHDFILDCLELNPVMLERGREAAASAGLSDQLTFNATDLNAWNAEQPYDAAIAIQSLHHVVNLENLFDQVKQSLRPGGAFLISDMIGRNGHQRWPEALEIVHEFWRKLPPSYRFNTLLNRYEELYESWDCSQQGFEGVRAQDILPLLLDRFHFQFFFPYGNVIDPFVDRAFGLHFDSEAAWDRSFIDAVHHRDDDEMAAGRLKPTHMLAVIGNEPCATPVFPGNLSPQFCVRPVELFVQPSNHQPQSPYDWSWPQDVRTELDIACQHLAKSGQAIKAHADWAYSLQNEVAERTAWALGLEKDMHARTPWAVHIQGELEDRTAWALSLQSDVEQRTTWALDLQKQLDALQKEFEERTAWALRLKDELADQTARAEHLEAERHKLTRNPLYLLRRVLAKLFS